MRFSTRSKVSILLSLTILLALAGGFFVYGAMGSKHAAHAAGGPTMTVGHLTYLGTSSIKPSRAASTTGSVSNEISVQPQDDIAKTGTPGPSTPTTAPNPTPNPVATSNRGVVGFPGINHADQRHAGGGNQFSLEPPDQGLCVGNGSVVEPVNDAVAVYTASTHVIVLPTTTLSSFFGLPPTIQRTTPPVFGPFLSDPKCYFDHATQTWFLTTLEIDTDPVTGAFGTHAATLIAVSQTSSPAGAWTILSLDNTDLAHTGCPCLGDQPLIGADANGFYISTNEFPISGPGFNGAQIYAISKQGLVSTAHGGPLPTVVQIDASQVLMPFGGLSYSIQPATSPDGLGSPNKKGTEYFLSALDFTGTLDNRVAAWALTNTNSLNSTPNLTLTAVVLNSEVYGQPPSAGQKSGLRPLGTSLHEKLERLSSNDDRMNQVVFANDLIWGAVNTVVKASGDVARVGIAYFVVQPDWSDMTFEPSVAHQGYVSVQQENVLFPSIGVTSGGKAVMVFTLVGKDYYPSTAYVVFNTATGPGSVHISGVGALPEDGFSGYVAFGGNGVARWGDYTAAVVDNGKIWIAAEYIPNAPRTPFANWGTFISVVNPNAANN